MQLLKIQKIGHLIAKKIQKTKIYFINKFERATHITLILHFSFLTFNLTLNNKINIQLSSNLDSIALKQSSSTQLIF